MVWISRKNYAALQSAAESLRTENTELKGYYENASARNKYFASIASLLTGNEVSDVYQEMDRVTLKKCYESNGPAFGIVNKIARAVGDVFPYLELQKIGGDFVEDHWLLDLLRRPNDRYNGRRFGMAWAINRLVYGDAFVYAPKVLGKNYGEGTEMYVLPGHRIKIDKGGYKTPFKSISITGGAQEVAITSDEFFQSFAINLEDTTFFGFSPLVAAATYLSIIDRGMKREDVSLKHGGAASIITPAKDNMGIMPKDKDEVEAEFNNKQNFGKTRALRVPIEVHQLGASPIDLGILDSHKEAVTALCFVYDVPMDLYYGQAKYENAKEAKKSLYEANAVPLVNEFAADLLAHYDLEDEFTLTVNTDRIDVLKDDAADVLDNLTKMHATLNEMREANGYERIEEPYADQPMLPMSTMFGPESFGIDETAPTGEPAQE